MMELRCQVLDWRYSELRCGCGGALEWNAKVCFAVGGGAAVGEAEEDRGP